MTMKLHKEVDYKNYECFAMKKKLGKNKFFAKYFFILFLQKNVGVTFGISQEIQCLLCAGFFFIF